MYNYAYADSAIPGYGYIFLQEELNGVSGMKNIFKISPEGGVESIFGENVESSNELNTSIEEILIVVSTWKLVDLDFVIEKTNLSELQLGLSNENVKSLARDFQVKIIGVEDFNPNPINREFKIKILSVEPFDPGKDKDLGNSSEWEIS
jgi:hypothetical protein